MSIEIKLIGLDSSLNDTSIKLSFNRFCHSEMSISHKNIYKEFYLDFIIKRKINFCCTSLSGNECFANGYLNKY